MLIVRVPDAPQNDDTNNNALIGEITAQRLQRQFSVYLVRGK
jgi:hypothetical protein